MTAGRWPPPQLSLPKGTGDTKAEHHHAEALDRPTVESEGGTTGRKTPGIGDGGSWKDKVKCNHREGW